MRRRTALIVGAHVLCGIGLLAISWRRWADPLIDSGRELYIPWQIAHGRVLYRDIDSLFGPLSPYLNSLWFRAFGVSMQTLAIVNIAIFGAMLAGIYDLIRRSADRTTATAASLSAMCLFGFSQYSDLGNYNFVAPYSHDATHGLALSIAMVIALCAAFDRRGATLGALLSVVAGTLCGLVFLTKPEMSLAASAAAAAGWFAAWRVDRSHSSPLWRPLACFIASTAVAPFCFAVFFATGGGMSWPEALRAVANGWIVTATTPIAGNAFYVAGAGLDNWLLNLLRLFIVTAGVAAFGVVAVAVTRLQPRTGLRRAAMLAVEVGLMVAAGLLAARFEFSRALPLIGLTVLVASWRLRIVPLLMWSAFSVVLLAKMWLHARWYQYGFVLALPATTVAVVMFTQLFPLAVRRWLRPDGKQRLRVVVLGTLAVLVAVHVARSTILYRGRDLTLGSGGDRFYGSSIEGYGTIVGRALDRLARLTPPDGRFVVVPEGVMLNYLLRRESPLRMTSLMPPEILAFGEHAAVEDLERRPPDYVVLIERDVSEYGYPPFGSPGYGAEIVSWIRERYEPAPQGDASQTSGLEILKRRP